jgi:peroxiredoxin
MSTDEWRRPVQVGERAPDFSLPLVAEDGNVSLADFRGRMPLLLVINRGLWCSFCRRYIVQLRGPRERLRKMGIDTLVIIASELERARLYLKHHPLQLLLAADPECLAHRAYGLPKPRQITAEDEARTSALRVAVEDTAVTADDLGRLRSAAQAIAAEAGDVTHGSRRLPYWDFIHLQRKLYPYQLTPSEQQAWDHSRGLGTGQFFIDRDGIVRWLKMQSTVEPPAALGNFASENELLAAAESVAR